jgi:hypothetical protein
MVDGMPAANVDPFAADVGQRLTSPQVKGLLVNDDSVAVHTLALARSGITDESSEPVVVGNGLLRLGWL